MLYVYGTLMPLRVLEEVRFWKMQEKEHTVVIRELVANLEDRYVKLLKEWEKVFARTEAAAVQWIEAVIRSPVPISPRIYSHVQSLVHTSTAQSQSWVQQLFIMQEQSAAIKANPTAPVVIQHIIRESEYFLGILQVVLSFSPEAVHPLPLNGYTAPIPSNPTSLNPVYISRGDESLPENPSQFEATLNSVREERDPAKLLSATGEGVWSTMSVESVRPVGSVGSVGSVGAIGSSEPGGIGSGSSKAVPIGGHSLPPLPYAYNALEPYIDAETMKIHHDKHHLSYVEGLNKAEIELEKARKTGKFDLVKHWERELAFNGAGHYLHTIFWNIMSPQGGGKPDGAIADQINKSFGSFDHFRKQFSAAAEKVEGGGWAILVWSPRSHRLEILQAEKHQNLSQWDVIPLLVLDVWEHAYYLKYKNERPKYVDAWWNVVHWQHINDRYSAAQHLKWPPY